MSVNRAEKLLGVWMRLVATSPDWSGSARLSTLVATSPSQLSPMVFVHVIVSPCRSLFVASQNLATSQPRHDLFVYFQRAPEGRGGG